MNFLVKFRYTFHIYFSRIVHLGLQAFLIFCINVYYTCPSQDIPEQIPDILVHPTVFHFRSVPFNFYCSKPALWPINVSPIFLLIAYIVPDSGYLYSAQTAGVPRNSPAPLHILYHNFTTLFNPIIPQTDLELSISSSLELTRYCQDQDHYQWHKALGKTR